MQNKFDFRKNASNGVVHREKQAIKSQQLSESAREIGEIPKCENYERYLSGRNLRTFCETYFAAQFNIPWAKCHLEAIEKLEDAFHYGGKIAIALPRGFGKTTMVCTAALWAILYGYRKFVVVVGASSPIAKNIISNLKKDIQHNKLLLADFPEAIFPFRKLKGTAKRAQGQLYQDDVTDIYIGSDCISFASIPGALSAGATIMAAGIDSSLRGPQRKLADGTMVRPDIVILDDPQTDANARSPRQIKKRSEIIDGTLKGFAGPGVELTMVMTCTVIQPGDLAELYLSNYPGWRSIRYRLIDKMPTNMELWGQYKELRKHDFVSANEFYLENYDKMREGAEVEWPDNFSANEMDAVHSAMNKWSDNYVSFMSEYQNEPVKFDETTSMVSAEYVRNCLNGLPRCTLPKSATTVTGFVDFHDDILYYVVMAWEPNFTGYVLDYGTWPRQSTNYFFKSDNNLVKFEKSDAARQSGLVELLRLLLLSKWRVASESDVVDANDLQKKGEFGSNTLPFGSKLDVLINKILVDSKYKPEIIDNAFRLIGSLVVMPSEGTGVKATNKQIANWVHKPGMYFGKYWVDRVPFGRSVRVLTFDTNYWKSRVHSSFALGAGSVGSITLFGSDSDVHRMFSESMVSEYSVLVESGDSKVNEWFKIPGRDNHFFDCVVGNFAAASYCGICDDADAVVPRFRRQIKVW